MKAIEGVLIAVVSAWTGNVLADDGPATPGVFPKGWYAAPMGSYMKPDKERCGASGGPGGAVILGHRGEFAAIEVWGQFLSLPFDCNYRVPAPTPTDPNATAPVNENGNLKLTGGGIGLMVGPFFEQEILSRFFGIVGFGVLKENNVAKPLRDNTSLAGDAGLGYLQPFHLFGRTLSARAELRYRYDYQEPPRPANAPSTFSDLVFNLGVQIPLSGEEEPAVKPAVTVVPATTGDSDQDGVPDDRDQCANTPPGSYVNNVGCPREPEAVVAPATTTEADEGPVTLENAKAGDTIVLTGVTFEFNSSRLTSNAQVILDPVARQLIQRPELRIEVGGHTDGKGSAAYNQKLSERRAASVKSYLEQHGVDASRLSSKGYGMTQPVDTNETDEGREHNRRVEMKVLE